MKQIYLSLLAAFLCFAMTSCDDDEPVDKMVPVEINGISKIEKSYERGLHEYLVIEPTVAFEFTKADIPDIEYEWGIDFKVVSTEKDLKFKCDKLGKFKGYFKASSKFGAKISEFELIVTSPYDKGLLLLTKTENGSMLSFKRLDKMDVPFSLNAFKDNNESLALGAEPLDICWKDKAMIDYDETEVVISTQNPLKVYTMDPNTMQVKTEIIYNGEGEFHPNNIWFPDGMEQNMWLGEYYFTGNGQEYILSSDKQFISGGDTETAPDGVHLNDITCSLITEFDDRLKVFFDDNTKALVYNSGIFGLFDFGEIGSLGVDLIDMHPCDAIYRDEVADYNAEFPRILVIGNTGNAVKVFHVRPQDLMAEEFPEEFVLKEISAAGSKLNVNSATAVNPTKPLLYFSNEDGNIYILNYEGGNFDSKPYITLGSNFEVKKIIFNPYDRNTMYIAAHNKDEQGDLKASVFIYSLKGNTPTKLFEGHQVGGEIKELIYKGNGREAEDNFNGLFD